MTARRVRCTVESMNYSACGHEPGDSFEIDDAGVSIPTGPSGDGFCYFAVAAVAQLLSERQAAEGGAGEWLAGRPVVMCPDPPEGFRMRLESIPVGEEEE